MKKRMKATNKNKNIKTILNAKLINKFNGHIVLQTYWPILYV